MRGADLPKSASAPAAARKLWRVGLVLRPTLRPPKGRERPHLPRQQLIIFLTLHYNRFKKSGVCLTLIDCTHGHVTKKWPGSG